MKKVKIMLTAITVLAVVGGALAFKAKKFSNICYFSSTQAHSGNGDYCLFNTAADLFDTGGSGDLQFATTVAKPIGGCAAILTPVCPVEVRTTEQ